MRVALVLPAALIAACLAGGAGYLAAADTHATTAGRPARNDTAPSSPASFSAVARLSTPAPAPTARPKPKATSTPVSHAGPAGPVSSTTSGAPLAGRVTKPPANHVVITTGNQGIVEAGYAQQIFQMIVQERHDAGQAPIQWSAGLAAIANTHTLKAAKYNPASPENGHSVPGEASLTQRYAAAGEPTTGPAGDAVPIGENMGLIRAQLPSEDGYIGTFAAVESIQTMMINEPTTAGGAPTGHRRNILWPYFKYVGVSVVWDQVTNTMWLTEDFAN